MIWTCTNVCWTCSCSHLRHEKSCTSSAFVSSSLHLTDVSESSSIVTVVSTAETIPYAGGRTICMDRLNRFNNFDNHALHRGRGRPGKTRNSLLYFRWTSSAILWRFLGSRHSRLSFHDINVPRGLRLGLGAGPLVLRIFNKFIWIYICTVNSPSNGPARKESLKLVLLIPYIGYNRFWL